MSSTLKIRVFCGISVAMSLSFYFYWGYSYIFYDEYTVNLIANNKSIAWFALPSWVHELWVPIAILIYALLGAGWLILKHVLLVFVLLGIFLGFSSESTCFTSLDTLFLDLWKMSDGVLIYLLYFESKRELGPRDN